MMRIKSTTRCPSGRFRKTRTLVAANGLEFTHQQLWGMRWRFDEINVSDEEGVTQPSIGSEVDANFVPAEQSTLNPGSIAGPKQSPGECGFMNLVSAVGSEKKEDAERGRTPSD